jgi:hypothetical protein
MILLVVRFRSFLRRSAVDTESLVGGWPAEQSIKRITSLAVHFDSDRINGLGITYELKSGVSFATSHGQSIGELKAVPLEEGAPFSLGTWMEANSFVSFDRHPACQRLWVISLTDWLRNFQHSKWRC